MKRITARVSLMVVVLLFAAASFGQQHQTLNFKADVPFEFSVGKTTLPAGEYLVTEIANHTLALRNSSNRETTIFMAGPAISLAGLSPNLKFQFEDGHAALSEVWSNGGIGYQLSVPKRPVTLAQSRPNGAGMQAVALSPVGK
jgi:hypothetical protein